LNPWPPRCERIRNAGRFVVPENLRGRQSLWYSLFPALHLDGMLETISTQIRNLMAKQWPIIGDALKINTNRSTRSPRAPTRTLTPTVFDTYPARLRAWQAGVPTPTPRFRSDEARVTGPSPVAPTRHKPKHKGRPDVGVIANDEIRTARHRSHRSRRYPAIASTISP
jgi:hypothetical protein